MVDSKAYETIGYEQGRSMEALAHFNGTNFKGATVTYNVIEW